jgi:hypothetical protein
MCAEADSRDPDAPAESNVAAARDSWTEPEEDAERDPEGDRAAGLAGLSAPKTVPVFEKSPENASGIEFSPDSCTNDSAGGLTGGLASTAICKSFPS